MKFVSYILLLFSAAANAQLVYSTPQQWVPANFCSELVQLQSPTPVAQNTNITFYYTNVSLYADARCTQPLVNPFIAANTNFFKFYFRSGTPGTSWIMASTSIGSPSQWETIQQPRTVGTNIVASNSGFEEGKVDGNTRPAHWYIGTKDKALPNCAGNIDDTQAFHGRSSLRLNPTGECFANQLLHVPGAGLAGKTISFKVKIKHQGMSPPPAVIMYALNPEITTPDPILGAPGISVSTIAHATTEQGVWREVVGSMVSPTETIAVGILLVASGSGGTAWFDQVEVISPKYNLLFFRPSTVPAVPISQRKFDMGFTANAPMDQSERGFENLVAVTKNTGNLLNFFVPIQWCYFPGQPSCENNLIHKNLLRDFQQARARGLKIALTFNFTHGSAATVGDLNPIPNVSLPPEVFNMNNPDIRNLMKAELLWFIGKLWQQYQIAPEYLINGIEMDIMYDKHPDWWGGFVAWHGEIYDYVHSIAPQIHVTTYARHEWLVDSNGLLNQNNANIWRTLLGKIESIGISSYPGMRYGHTSPQSIPAAYFARPMEVNPSLPLFVAEFGVDSKQWSEQQQAELLQRITWEWNYANAKALIYFQPFDMNYLGQPQWFKDAWSKIGLARIDGYPKTGYFFWSDLSKLPLTP